jgi:hypothetical protein
VIVESKIKTFNTPKRLEDFSKQIGSKTMLQIGNVAKALIIQRTLAGKDASGSAFTPYSTTPRYLPIKKRPVGYPAPAGGQTTKGGKTMFFSGGWKQYKSGIGLGARPQLSVSGKMLNDIQVRAEEEKAILYFGSARSGAIAHGHHFGTTVPRREFFDIGKGPREVDALENELATLIVEYAHAADVPLKGAA